MINLLPPGQKKTMEKEYAFRLGSTYILLTSIAIFIGLVLLLPSFFLVNTKTVIAEQELLAVQGSMESTRREELNEQLREAKETLAILTNEDNQVALYSVVDRVILHAMGLVEISTFSYVRTDSEQLSTLSVGGVAKTRDTLISFKRALENDRMFDEVILPVSSLAKESDIEFSIQIKGNI